MDFSCPHTCMEPTNIPQWQGCGFDLEFSATRLPFPPFKNALMRSLSLTVFTLVLAAVLNLASSPLTNAQTPPDGGRGICTPTPCGVMAMTFPK